MADDEPTTDTREPFFSTQTPYGLAVLRSKGLYHGAKVSTDTFITPTLYGVSMGEVDPIDVGATFAVGKTKGRITNIWIDEDGVPHLTIRWTNTRRSDDPDEKVAYEDLRKLLESGEAERTNSGHEAWKWRAEHIDV